MRRKPTSRRALATLVLVLGIGGVATACVPRPSGAPNGSPEAVIREVFGPLGQADNAVAVASCESGLNPGAVGGGGKYIGLFQLDAAKEATANFYGGTRYDVWPNVQTARDLYLDSGRWGQHWPTCGAGM